MSGLVLKLGPKERVLVNGAVIENGDKRTRLSIQTPNANILRLRDAIHPSDAKTPVRRLCYSVQLVLSGDADGDKAQINTLKNIEHLSQVFTDPDSRSLLAKASNAALSSNYYMCLKALRALIPREDRLMAAAT
ncbi:flagellar biosynthesis repressor FlbT [Pseudoprimorskyibacter insulae]|uniref:Flagellum biosynthesis repressor protein FlbT n=1 Tax=Pseudoprimorskyibacter insulae TaxID=1695997 RepID=A0A2R8AYV7_9RHOB|nr:flagellar biosynthesis repressor FlbT [Pseudoprimorskyibacter insulae]SPF81208.1 flagellum biosynthesis repressor protein FlbT [Pseudoprimorskyibacter insulae]